MERSNFDEVEDLGGGLDAGLATQASWALDGANNWDSYNGVRSGEIFTRSHAHDANNAIRSIADGTGEVEFAVDENGNRLADDRHGYAWDAYNRLRTVHDPGTEDLVATYTYDSLGRRIGKTVGNDTTLFVYDGVNVIEEYNATGSLLRQFVHGAEINHPLLMDTDLDGDGIATGDGDRRLHYLQDGLGSVAGLVDDDGQLIEGYLYDAYGQTAVIRPGANGVVDWGGDDVVSSESNVGNPYGFTGQRLDAETGLYYYRARYYDALTGNFLSRDPLGVWGDELSLGNAYAYVGAMPLTYVDWFGLCGTIDVACHARAAARKAAEAAKKAADAARRAGQRLVHDITNGMTIVGEAVINAAQTGAEALASAYQAVTGGSNGCSSCAAVAAPSSVWTDAGSGLKDAATATGSALADTGRAVITVSLANPGWLAANCLAWKIWQDHTCLDPGEKYCGYDYMEAGTSTGGLSELSKACVRHDECIGELGKYVNSEKETFYSGSKHVRNCNFDLAKHAIVADCNSWECRAYDRPAIYGYAGLGAAVNTVHGWFN
jgi:RHS repeat-associated protein